MTYDRVIGNGSQLPWHIPEELKFFKEMTTNKTLIMGANTLKSIGKTLPNRNHVIISSKPQSEFDSFGNIAVCNDIDSAITKAKSFRTDVFVVGGLSIYKQFLETNICDSLIISWIKDKYVGDVIFPNLIHYPYKVDSIVKESSEFITMRYIRNDNKHRS